MGLFLCGCRYSREIAGSLFHDVVQVMQAGGEGSSSVALRLEQHVVATVAVHWHVFELLGGPKDGFEAGDWYSTDAVRWLGG